MKLFKLFVWGGLSLYMQSALAVPVLYILEGNVSNLYDMGSNSDLSVGDPISYSFLVDDDISSWVNPEGRTVEYGHSISPPDEGWIYHDYNYYAEFVGGNQIFVDENTTGYNPRTGNSYGQLYARVGYTPQGSLGDRK